MGLCCGLSDSRCTSHPPFKSAPWATTTRAAWQQGFRLPPPLWLSGSPYMIHSSTIPHTTTNDKADFSESLFPIAPQTGQIISSPTPTSFNVRLHMDFNSQQQQQASNPLLFKNLHVLCWSYFQIPTAENGT